MQDGGVVTVAMISRDACKTSIVHFLILCSLLIGRASTLRNIPIDVPPSSYQPVGISILGIGAAASLQASKALAEGSWAKRSAGTRERLQPIRADATCAATHDNNNNSLKPIEAGAENKSEVQQLTKRIPSGDGNFKVKKSCQKHTRVVLCKKCL